MDEPQKKKITPAFILLFVPFLVPGVTASFKQLFGNIASERFQEVLCFQYTLCSLQAVPISTNVIMLKAR
jgi:hypothetical protein